jgi:NADH:ubiquinone oxidoreductase subunit 4 (subunit M)
VDLNGRELATLVPLVALCFWIGIYPKPVLSFLHVPLARVADTVQPGKFAAAPVHAAAPTPADVPTTRVEEPPIVPER